MVNYQCPRCGFNTNIKTKYTSHLGRKFICKNNVSDDTLDLEYQKYNITTKLNSNIFQTKIQQYPKNIQHNSNLFQTKIQQYPKNQNSEIDKNYICEFCDKKFKYNQSYYRHLKNCKIKKETDEDKSMNELVNLLNQQLIEQREQMKKKDKQIEELIKKAGITNINIQQNNYKLLAYQNTDISHLTDSDFLKCLNHNNMCVPHLIKKINFDPLKPENHNIYISNIKNNYVLAYNGIKWQLQNRDDVINNLIDEKEFMIEQKLEEWIENGKNYPDIMKKFNRYLEKKENDIIVNKIKDEIKLMLFNNRKISNK